MGRGVCVVFFVISVYCFVSVTRVTGAGGTVSQVCAYAVARAS